MADAACEVHSRGGDAIVASFDVPQWAPTPGQYLVLYDGDVCLGGAVIDVPLASTESARSVEATAAG
jgi:tRNA-specific 2-thiouridylase